jgi:DNA helicase TIP49 (TBP-interacting protein)
MEWEKEDGMPGRGKIKNSSMHFKTVEQSDVPQGRNGKHKLIVTTILKDLDNLAATSAIKVPLGELAESKEKVRSALNRATRKAGRKVATASDDSYLYVWTVAE